MGRAVLVAISIPIFTSQLEKSREATDLANLRSAYAECSAAVLSETTASTNQDASKGVVVTVDPSSKIVTAKMEVTLTQQVANWSGTNGKDVAGKDISATTALTVGEVDIVSVSSDGTVSIAPRK